MAKSKTLSETRQKFEEWWKSEDGSRLPKSRRPFKDFGRQAFEAGRLQGLEEAAKIADELWKENYWQGPDVAAAIREKANE
jgi:hypothetical protein